MTSGALTAPVSEEDTAAITLTPSSATAVETRTKRRSLFRLRKSSTTAACALRSRPSNLGVQTIAPATSAWSSPDGRARRARRRELHLQRLDLALARLQLLAQPRVLVDELAAVDARRALELLEDALVLLRAVDGRVARSAPRRGACPPRCPARR